jgi:hypothetical protein
MIQMKKNVNYALRQLVEEDPFFFSVNREIK